MLAAVTPMAFPTADFVDELRGGDGCCGGGIWVTSGGSLTGGGGGG